MTVTSIGDMAQHMMMTRRNAEVQSNLNRLAYELGSGRLADPAASLRGDFNVLASVERQLTVLDGYAVATKDAELFTETAQNTLEMVQTVTGDLARDLLSATESGLTAATDTVARHALNDFQTIVSALNSRVADRNIFGGTATDSATLIPADDMMADIQAAVTAAGAITPMDMVAAIDDYFMSAGGGFETTAYVGSTTDLSPFRLNDLETASFNLRADDTALRQAMRDSAIAAFAVDPTMNFDLVEKQQIFELAGTRLLSGQDDIVTVRADIGFNQERIENAMANNTAQQSAMLMTQTDLLAADQTDVAGQLQATQVQLEMIYTITARLSQLTLANYIR